MKPSIFLIMILPVSSLAQVRSGNAETTASCSPAVTGNSNQITVTCNGLSKEKADDMVRLMNSILSRQLDPKKVYGELDQIYGKVSDMSDTINAAINPLANAPPEVVERLTKGQRLATECGTFTSEWSNAVLRATQDSSKKIANDALARNEAMVADSRARSSALQARRGLASTSAINKPEIDGPFSARYAKELAPTLIAWRREVLSHASFLRSAQDWTNANEIGQLRFICAALHQLQKQYSASSVADYALIQKSQTVGRSCDSFAEEWSQALGVQSAPSPQQSISGLGYSNPEVDKVNAEQVAHYKETLEGKLAAWRDDMLTQLPGTQKKDYGAISDTLSAGQVCRDVSNIVLAYRLKLQEDLLKKKPSPAGKK